MATQTIITLDNLALYKTLTDSQIADVKSTLENEIADARLPYKLVDSLPNASADCVETLYLVPSLNTGTSDIYEEYLCVEKDGAYSWERFGTVSVTEITKGTSTGSGNAVTDISISGNTITLTFGSTFTTASDVTSAISSAIGTTITAAALGALTAITATDSGSGSVVTGVSASGGTITVTKGDISVSFDNLTDVAIATEDDIKGLFEES